MILDGEMLPATQHYTLLAIAIALYAATVVNVPRTSKALWFAGAAGLVPILHMEMSVYAALSDPLSWKDSSLLLHGVAIALVVPIAIELALGFKSRKVRRKLRVEPKVPPLAVGRTFPSPPTECSNS